MIGKIDQNGFSAVDYSIFGQPPSAPLIECGHYKGLSINNDHILLVFSSAFDVTARLT